MTHPPGTIGLACGELARFTAFTVSLAATEQPENTALSVVTSASVTDNLNAIIRGLRDIDEWLWLTGDDHCWAPDSLIRLLDTMDDTGADIVVPLTCRRNPPWDLVVYREQTGVDENGYPLWRPFHWSELPESGPFEIAAAGSAGMLIKRSLLDRLGDPWFGSTTGIVLNEDLWFCQRARELGARMVADSSVLFGHVGVFRVSPRRRNGEWGTLTDYSVVGDGSMDLFLPGGPREVAGRA